MVALDAGSSILEQCADAAVVIDAAGLVTVFNAAAERLFGAPRDQVLGRPADAVHAAFSGLFAHDGAGAQSDQEIRIVRPDGGRGWGLLSLSKITGEGEVACLALLKDVTTAVDDRRRLRMFIAIADGTTRAVMVTDMTDRIVYVNKAFTRVFGRSAEEAVGAAPARILAGRYTDRATLDRLRRQCTVNVSATDEILAYDKQGREVWISATVNIVRNRAGVARNVVALIDDITEAKRIQLAQNDVLDALANDWPLASVGDLICRNIAVIAPDALASILRVDGEGRLHPVAGPGLPLDYVRMIAGVSVGPDVGACGAAAFSGLPVLAEDIATDPRWAAFRDIPLELGLRACWSTPIKTKDGRIVGAFAFYFRERRGPSPWHEKIVAAIVHLCALAIERHDAQMQIRRLAYFDALTGLPNRSNLRETFQSLTTPPHALERAAFLFLDIDNFKDVNDTLGHAVGDSLLAAISDVLKQQVRAIDIVSRHGGDEFVIVMPDCDAAGAATAAESIKAAFAAPIAVRQHHIAMTTSIGVSLYPDHGADADTLLAHADAAMYAAKRSGRSTHRLFDPAMRRAIEERLAYSSALRSALANDCLRLHYQPQVWTTSGVVRGVEALARWRDPALGDVSPARFIPIAEEYGLIEALGEWSLRAAARQLAAWRAAGLAIPVVSVNLSPAHFQSPGLAGLIAGIVADNGLRPSDLVIEITEGAIMNNRAASLATARALDALGVGLSMDDFGAGYSNLSRLAQLPIRELKIDRSLIRHIEIDLDARAVARIAIEIGRSLRKVVVAEGVETPGQKRVLSELGCDVLQGYLYAPALQADDLHQWVLGLGAPDAELQASVA